MNTMEAQAEKESEEIIFMREHRRQLRESIDSQRRLRDDFMHNLSSIVPELVTSLELSLKVATSVGGLTAKKRERSEKRQQEQSFAQQADNKSSGEYSRGVGGIDGGGSSNKGILSEGGGGAGAGAGALRNAGGSGLENRVLSRGGSGKVSNGEIDSRFGRRGGSGGVGGEGWSSDNGGKGGEKWGLEDNWSQRKGGGGSSRMEALAVVKGMVASCLLAPSTSVPLDSTGIHRRLTKEPTVTERDALAEVGGQAGGAKAVENALNALAESTNGGVELEEFAVSGKTRLMVLGIDRNRLSKEVFGGPLPPSGHRMVGGGGGGDQGGAPPAHMMGMVMGMPGVMEPNGVPPPHNLGPPGHPRPDMWGAPGNDPHLQGGPGPGPGLGPGPPMFPGGPGGPPPSMGQRGGPRGMPPGIIGMPGPPGLGMGFGGMPGPFQRPPLVQQGLGVGPPGLLPKTRSTDEEEMKDLETLLNKKSYRELQQSKTGEELLELLHRPTAKETAVAAKFKTKGGSALKEYCPYLTKEDCRRQRGSFMACEKVHFRRIIAPHTDSNLGDCSFLDTCRHMKTCKYVHYELDPTQDVRGMMAGVPGLPPPLRPQSRPRRAEYCSDAELGEPQWINCDIRNFKMDVLGQFGVIMADPPWDIHMELPYGTMADDEMRNLNVPVLQTDGLIFLWVTGRAMELGRECLELWGYRRVEEMIWVKTNQLQRIIRTGRTGHWLNHSKEHCLVGIKGNPELNRNIDTDVIVAEVRETSRKPDEMYPLLERISPHTRKLELFARMHNTHAGWISLGNQLNGVRLVDEALRTRFKSAYPETEFQPADPPGKLAGQDGDMVNPAKTPPVTTATPLPLAPPPATTATAGGPPLVKETVELSTTVTTVIVSRTIEDEEKRGSDKDSEMGIRAMEEG